MFFRSYASTDINKVLTIRIIQALEVHKFNYSHIYFKYFKGLVLNNLENFILKKINYFNKLNLILDKLCTRYSHLHKKQRI